MQQEKLEAWKKGGSCAVNEAEVQPLQRVCNLNWHVKAGKQVNKKNIKAQSLISHGQQVDFSLQQNWRIHLTIDLWLQQCYNDNNTYLPEDSDKWLWFIMMSWLWICTQKTPITNSFWEI